MRNIICLLILLALTVSLCLRTFISMLIVVMTRSPTSFNSINETIEDDGLLEWSQLEKSIVLSAPLLGCLFSLPFYFFLSSKLTPKKLVLVIIVFQSFLSFLSPFIARFSFISFVIIRIILGVAEGCVMPALNSMAAAWFPSTERVSKVAIYTCGFQLAFGGVQYLVSFLSSLGVAWPVIFYAGGAIALLFSVFWFIFVSDSPTESRFIGKDERQFILEHIPKTGGKPTSTPWKAIIQSPAIWAHLLCMIGFYFAIGVTSNLLPLYLKEELSMPLTMSGAFTFVPFIFQIISKFIAGFVVDWLKKNKGLGHTTAAKWCQSIGSIGSALSLFALPFCHFNYWVAFFALVSYGATFSLCVCGFYTSMTMIAPRYTGSISSLINEVGFTSALLALGVFQFFIKMELNNKFFFLFGIAGILQMMGGVAYLLWGTADVQPWATSFTPPSEIVMKPLLNLKNTKVTVTVRT